VKGLEFEHIVVASANTGTIPLDAAMEHVEDQAAQVIVDTAERSLLYVAMTRAKRSATITGYGELSPYLTDGQTS
jgi:superfamily I DNA/RNA helicase